MSRREPNVARMQRNPHGTGAQPIDRAEPGAYARRTTVLCRNFTHRLSPLRAARSDMVEEDGMIVPGRLRALVVDDNTYARAICIAGLKKLGIAQTSEAANGAEAILQLMSEPFSFVLMDWYMPDINGAGVMEVLRDDRFGAGANTPVIMMTAYPSRDNVARARTLGVTEILSKPFSTEQLGMAVGRVLSPKAADDSAVFL